MTFGQQLRQAEKYLSTNDKKLAPVINLHGPCKLTPHTDYYKELVSGIVSQQLSVRAAATIWQRVLGVFGGKMPEPRQFAAADTEALRACGVSYPKIGYMKDLASRVIDGRLDMAHITSLPNPELIEQLATVKGIGEWSAHMFMIFSLGRLDILPVGDLGIRKAAQRLYNLTDLPKDADLRLLSEIHHWHPYESVASWYLWRSLENT